MSNTVRYSVADGLARITLCRPPLNVLTVAMLDELTAALERAASASDVRVVRLDAEGKAFSAGVDVADHTAERVRAMMDALARLFGALENLPAPSVSVVHGAALGGGCELALGTDLCVASAASSFGQPEIRLALFAPPASLLLPRLVGERRALGILLGGDTLTAADAERMGLVNAVLPAEAFDSAADAWVGRLLALSGAALRLAKRAVRLAREQPASAARRALERLYLDELMATADAHEGLAAFLAKRKPQWQHR